MVEERLRSFLHDAAAKRFSLGSWDCGLWLADWYVAATGKPDPAREYRGAVYDNKSLTRTTREVVKRLNLQRTSTPGLGDIGIIRCGDAAFGAIKTAQGWAMIGERGISRAIAPKVLGAWRIDECHKQ